jgi:hypothetical protein
MCQGSQGSCWRQKASIRFAIMKFQLYPPAYSWEVSVLARCRIAFRHSRSERRPERSGWPTIQPRAQSMSALTTDQKTSANCSTRAIYCENQAANRCHHALGPITAP